MGSPTTLQDANPKGIGCLPGTIFDWLELLIFQVYLVVDGWELM